MAPSASLTAPEDPMTLRTGSAGLENFTRLSKDQLALISRIVTEAAQASPHGQSTTFGKLLDAYHTVLSRLGYGKREKEAETEIYSALLKLGLRPGADWIAKWQGVLSHIEQLGLRDSQGEHDQPIAPKRQLATPRTNATSNLERAISELSVGQSSHRGRMRYVSSGDEEPPPAAASRIARDSPIPAKLRSITHLASRKVSSDSDGLAVPSLSSRMLAPLARSTTGMTKDAAAEAAQIKHQAVLHDRRLVLSRGLTIWRDRLERVHAITGTADQCSRRFALQHVLRHWHVATWQQQCLKDVADRLRLTLDCHLRARTMQNMLNVYRHRIEARHAQMLDRKCDKLVRARNRKLATSIFVQWLARAAAEQSATDVVLRFARRTFECWQKRAVQQQSLRTRFLKLQHRQDRQLRSAVLSRWRRRTELAIRCSDFARDNVYDIMLRTFLHWRRLKTDALVCQRVHRLALAGNSIRKWRSSLAAIDAGNSEAAELRRLNDMRIIARLLRYWQLRMKEVQILEFAEVKLQANALWLWHARIVENEINSKESIAVLQSNKTNRLRTRALDTWIARRQAIRGSEQVANAKYAFGLLQSVLRQWSQARIFRIAQQSQASRVHAGSIKRRYLQVWRLHLQRRRQNSLLARKQLVDLSFAFDVWRAAARRAIHDHHRIALVQADSCHRRLHTTISIWLERVIGARTREEAVDATRETAVVRQALSRWREKSARLKDRERLASSYRDVAAEGNRKRLFKIWLMKTRRKQESRRALRVRFLGTMQSKTAAIFRHWYILAKARRLQEPAALLLQAREEALLDSAFKAWAGKTQVLPALEFAKHHTKRHAFRLWHERLPLQAALNEAVGWRHQRIAASVLGIWRTKRMDRSAARAAQRFRSFAITPAPKIMPNIESARTDVLPSFSHKLRQASDLFTDHSNPSRRLALRRLARSASTSSASSETSIESHLPRARSYLTLTSTPRTRRP
ncbi:hypothetical protein E5Q_01079 [Mixia osmundae IAM 14324]|uniref:Sfi1 spindle body domain-containing protein n=2 Tax=Mixia osmundae (strain CBS 9802 / IAM 14324 / JCM 22182 / KY 12970) TaxID=764103 RepID=G7DV17_MIXOS|nr:hypothetical protein E5Q_01079 [Mixia osmundae IAM 14324]